MNFFKNILSILIFVALAFLLLPNPTVGAQQITEAQRQTFIAQIVQEIVQIRVQINQMLFQQAIIGAQQITEAQRQTFIAQIEQQIVQIRVQINQMLFQQSADPGVPALLEIPEINVDAVVNPVSITATGEMGAPEGPFDTAWFDLGPHPGENGSAVIAGHFGHWKIGVGSVFDNLSKLVKGDKIYIVDENGATITFVVRESRIYDPVADASIVFNSGDGKAHLNLVTCEGTWLPTQKTFTNRLVVFADKE